MRSTSFLLSVSVTVVIAALIQSHALSAADPAPAADPALYAAGKKVFTDNCNECHTIAKDGRPIMGPNLWGLMGKKVGSNKADFAYSDALVNSKVVWTPETLDKWIAGPAEFIPDNAMPYIGLKDPKDRAAVIAYIAKASTEEQ